MSLLTILKNSNRILGQNARNLNFLKEGSTPFGRKVADDKLLTKKLLVENDLPTPKLISTISNYKELQEFDWDTLPKSFVVKPVHGVQGGGIEIFYNKDTNGNWITADKTKVSVNELKIHISEILDGKYSISGNPDQVFFEERIRIHDKLKNYTYKGTPDVRIILYRSVPIMAYVRFPTKESKGKANMILGAVGTGIDISSGITTYSTFGKANGGRGESIEFVPGTKLRYQGLKIPYWDKILQSAVKVQKASKLRFTAIDFLIDQEKGPMVVEINSRPGLSIQLANQEGLNWRLQKAQGLKIQSEAHAIRLGKDLFGGEIMDEIERVSGKEVIKNVEPVVLFNSDKKSSTLALIDTSRRTTTIDESIAKKIGLIDFDLQENESEIEEIKIKISSKVIDSTCRIIKSKIKGYNIVIGRRDLGNFLVDIKKVEKPQEKEERKKINLLKPKTTFEELDRELFEISKKIAIIPALRPTNYEEEKNKFIEKNCEYNPKFVYKPIRFNPDYMFTRLNSLNPADNEIGKLYSDKISEIKKQILLIESIGQDADLFTERSIKLYGRPKLKYIKQAQELLKKYPKLPEDKSKVLDFSEIYDRIKQALADYEIDVEINVLKGEPITNKISVGKYSGKINIHEKCQRTEDSVNGMIAHEIGVHLVRLFNGKKQKYGIYEMGTAGYIKTEEGLATLAKFNARENKDMVIPAITYVSMKKALDYSFKETIEYLKQWFENDLEQLFNYGLKVKRGIANTSEVGGFTKDQYFGWAKELEIKEIDVTKVDLGKVGL